MAAVGLSLAGAVAETRPLSPHARIDAVDWSDVPLSIVDLACDARVNATQRRAVRPTDQTGRGGNGCSDTMTQQNEARCWTLRRPQWSSRGSCGVVSCRVLLVCSAILFVVAPRASGWRGLGMGMRAVAQWRGAAARRAWPRALTPPPSPAPHTHAGNCSHLTAADTTHTALSHPSSSPVTHHTTRAMSSSSSSSPPVVEAAAATATASASVEPAPLAVDAPTKEPAKKADDLRAAYETVTGTHTRARFGGWRGGHCASAQRHAEQPRTQLFPAASFSCLSPRIGFSLLFSSDPTRMPTA